MNSKIVENPQASRYEIYDGEELAGFAEYHLYRDEMAILHTEIDARLQGHGLAGKLTRHLLDDARKRGRTVLPYCPFTQQWILKHPEYVNLVPAGQRSHFDL